MPAQRIPPARAKALPAAQTSPKKPASAAKKPLPVKPKKRAPQHDSAYYAQLGERGGNALKEKKKRDKNYFADLARRSHPRAVYNGGRPKGTTAQKKAESEARMDALLKTAAKKLAKKKVK